MRHTGVQLLRQSKKLLDTFTTTPIYYANADPHIGHIYTSILADTSHRWNLLTNPDEKHIFSTGTDEHGSKQILEKGGYIYKSTYSGYYSVVDECFFPFDQVESKLVNGDYQKVVKGSNTLVEWVEEENYIFKLSHFREPVRKWLKESKVVQPTNYAALAESYTHMEEDLSVSRSSQRLSWGIPVPNDESQTIYVWMDALVNYLTVAGYPGKMNVWPPTCQIIGKDILKFHAFYWPAFLMAAELPLPKKLFVHGHWLADGVKMSKSLGNVVHPNDLADKYTVEGVRYFLLKQGNPHDDSNFSSSACFDVINSDLVNNIGNLLQRSTVKKMNEKEVYPTLNVASIPVEIRDEATQLIDFLGNLKDSSEHLYNEMHYYKVIEGIMNTMKEANRVFQQTQPWKERDEEKLAAILYLAYESVRISTIILQPIVPEFSAFCLDRLNIPSSQRGFENATFGNYNGGHLGENRGIAMKRLEK